MQLSLDITVKVVMFFNIPLAFSKDLQPCGTGHQLRTFTSSGYFGTVIDRLSTIAETGINQGKNRVSPGTRSVSQNACLIAITTFTT